MGLLPSGLEQNMPQQPSANTRYKALSIALISIAWLATTLVFWTGYVGSDDIVYARYAWMLHRPPMTWWEFRMPFILALHASFRLFGPSEVAATVPTMLTSLGILASVAWFVGWPRKLTWQSQFSMLIAATLPIEVSFRTFPSAPVFAGGLLALGTVFLLRPEPKWHWVAAPLLAIAFLTHETTFFYISLLCLTLVVFDWRRCWRRVLLCVLAAGLALAAECAVYWIILGDPLARLKVSAIPAATLPFGYDGDINLGGIRYFTWPIENLIFCKSFGFDLLLLLLAGIASWRCFKEPERMLFVAMFAFWFWLGFGTQVPWAYRPLGRQMHYYVPLTLGIAALLPAAVSTAFAARPRLWRGLLAAVVLVHLINLSAGGRWGQDVWVSRALLRFASSHPAQWFVTDARTMNRLYTLSGFRMPPNVVCVNGPTVLNHLRINDEPAGTPRFQFPETRVDAALINSDITLLNGRSDSEFERFLQEQTGKRIQLVPVRYKLLFQPLLLFMSPRPFMIRSLGGEMANVKDGAVTVNRASDSPPGH